jgi:hypothetical protein
MDNTENNESADFRSLAEKAVELFSKLNALHQQWDEGEIEPRMFYLNTLELAQKFAEWQSFHYKDKTGRGIHGMLNLADLVKIAGSSDELSYNDEELFEWAAEAKVGDEWESRTMRLTRIE